MDATRDTVVMVVVLGLAVVVAAKIVVAVGRWWIAVGLVWVLWTAWRARS